MKKYRKPYFLFWVCLPLINEFIQTGKLFKWGSLGFYLSSILGSLIMGAMLYILLSIVLMFYKGGSSIFVKIKDKFKPIKYKDTRNIKYFDDFYLFREELLKTHNKSDINTIGVMNDKDKQGAFVVLNSTKLIDNRNLISRNIVSRDSNERANADVPYFRTVSNTPVETIKGKEYPYHRTHLLPFRFCLSDGDIHKIMFTGTNHLNTGNRIYENYFFEGDYVDSFGKHTNEEESYLVGTRYGRQKILGDIVDNFKGYLIQNPSAFCISARYRSYLEDDSFQFGSYQLKPKGSSIHTMGLSINQDYATYDEIETHRFNTHWEELNKNLYFEKNTRISLDDIERFVTHFIVKSDPKKVFTYSVICEYNDDCNIPKGVTINFYDNSKKKMLLNIYLDNKN